MARRAKYVCATGCELYNIINTEYNNNVYQTVVTAVNQQKAHMTHYKECCNTIYLLPTSVITSIINIARATREL